MHNIYYINRSGFGRNESGTEIDMTSNSKPSLIRDNAKTTFVIDGFLSHGNTPMSQTIKDGKHKSHFLPCMHIFKSCMC